MFRKIVDPGSGEESCDQLSSRHNFAGAVMGDDWVATFMVHMDCFGAVLTMQWNQQPIKVPKGYCPSIKDVQEALRRSWRQKSVIKPSWSKISREVKVSYQQFFLCIPEWRCRSLNVTSHIDPRSIWGGKTTGRVRIDSRHVRILEKKITTEKVPPDAVVVDFMPQGYTLDDGTRMMDPVGSMTRRLHLDAHILVADGYWVREVLNTLEAEGVKADVITSAFSTAEGLLNDGERAGDTMVIDIGARNTYLGLHRSGSLCAVRTVEGGSDGVIVRTAKSLGQPVGDVAATIGQLKFSLYNSDADRAVKDSLFLWRTQLPMIRNLDNAAIPVVEELFYRVWGEIERLQAETGICVQNALVMGDDPLAVKAMLTILAGKTSLRCRWGVPENAHKHPESDSSAYAHMLSMVRKHGRWEQKREELPTKATAQHKESSANKLIEKGVSAVMAYVAKLVAGEPAADRRKMVLRPTFTNSDDMPRK